MKITSESAHPLCKANWIWPGGHMYIYNQYAGFRKDFELQEYKDAVIYITADQLYKLYINGKYICRGPARGYQSHWPFDEINITEFLQKGHNWISVLAYNPGISTNQYIHQGSVGFLCACVIDNIIIVSDDSWKMKRLKGFTQMTGRYSVQMAFQEHVNLSEYNNNWIYKSEDNELWEDSETDKISHHPIFSFGRAPYDSCETRDIPMINETFVIPERIVCKAYSFCEEHYKTWQNISWGWVKEAKKCENWNMDFPIRTNKNDDFFEFEIGKTEKDKYKSVTFDAGEYLVASLEVEIIGCDGKEIIDFQFHENIVNKRPSIRDEGSACQIALANRIYPRKNRCLHEFFHYLGFRYFTVIVRNSLKPVSISIKLHKIQYPFTMKGTFKCSDEKINQIFEICRRTQQICSLDAYVDTPWREQAQWWGDARVQAKNTFYLDGDCKLFKRGIRSIAGQSTSQGLTFGHAPTVGYNCILPDFSLTWIITLWDYYWQTEDISLFIEQYPRVKEILNYFNTEQARCSKTGLIKHDKRFWYFGDWSDIYKGYIPTLLNHWYALTLKTLAYLTDIAEMNSECAVYRKLFIAHKSAIFKHLFSEKECFFYGGLDDNLKPSDVLSVHDQVMGVLLNFTDKHEIEIFQKWVIPYLKDENINAALPSAFWNAYVLGRAGKLGYEKETLDFIKRKWSPMLSTGTTWETFDWSEKTIFSASHAWSAHPSYHFTNILTGIWQTAAGWKKVEFTPKAIEGLSFSESEIPSPKGLIKASWQKNKNKIYYKLNIPDGIEVTLRLSDKTEIFNKKGIYSNH